MPWSGAAPISNDVADTHTHTAQNLHILMTEYRGACVVLKARRRRTTHTHTRTRATAAHPSDKRFVLAKLFYEHRLSLGIFLASRTIP